MPLLVTAAEMRAIEAAAVQHGETWEGLMEQAGAAVARRIIDWLGLMTDQRVLVLAGPGNNGGDGLVVARHLQDHGWHVRCLTWARRMDPGDRLLVALAERDVAVSPVSSSDFELPLQEALSWSTVIVDGLLGTGL